MPWVRGFVVRDPSQRLGRYMELDNVPPQPAFNGKMISAFQNGDETYPQPERVFRRGGQQPKSQIIPVETISGWALAGVALN